jgi:MprA protease rhombosortase-interaction domain-containing protein
MVSLYMPTNLGGVSMPTTSQVTFEAVVVPEPSAFALAMIGAAAFIRRRFKA